MTPEQVSSHIEIQQALFKYCRAIDRGDLELLKSVYHPDARDAHGAHSGLAHEFAEKIVTGMDSLGVIGQHIISNVLIELTGPDTAEVESYFQAHHPSPTEDGVIALAFSVGRYLDRFERRAGVWKIADRRVIMDYSRAPSEGPPWATAANYPKGGRREADPSHGMFGAAGQAQPTTAS